MPIVTNPVAGDVHVNVPLTNFSQKYLQDMDMFVSTMAFPNSPVAKQSDLYYEFDRDDFFRDEAEERADGTESAGGSFNLSTEPYFAKVYAYHKDVTDRQRVNQDMPVQLDLSSTQFIMHKLMIRRERLFADTYFSSGVWATDDDTKNWSATVSDPIVDVRTAIRTVQSNTGYRPNKILMGRAAYDILLDNDAILSRITGGSTREVPARVMRELLSQMFEVEAIYVMDSIYTTTGAGVATQARQFIGTDNCLVYYAPNGVSLNEPSAGVQFSWTGMLGNTDNGIRVRRFRMEENSADRIEGEMAFDYKVTGVDLGYFFSGVTS